MRNYFPDVCASAIHGHLLKFLFSSSEPPSNITYQNLVDAVGNGLQL